MKINTGCFLDGCKCFDSDDEDGVEIKRDKEWVGLTDDEVSQMEKDYLWGGKEFNAALGYWAVYRAIEAKLKEKNT